MTIKNLFHFNKMSALGKAATISLIAGMGIFGAAIYENEQSRNQDLMPYEQYRHHTLYEDFADGAALLIPAGMFLTVYSMIKVEI